MVSLQLSVADLLRCRFAISPVNEVGEAGRAIANPPALAAHRAWLREHDPALQRLATALARELRIEPAAAEAVKTGPVSLDELRPGELRVVQ
jgi:hypothetical protein